MQTIYLDLEKLDVQRRRPNPIIYGRMGDSNSPKIRITLSKDGSVFPIPPSELKNIQFEGSNNGVKLFDKDGVNIFINNDYLKQGMFTYTFPPETFSQSGEYDEAYFCLEMEGVKYSTQNFQIIVYDSADVSEKEAVVIISKYNELVKKLNEIFDKTTGEIAAKYKKINSEAIEIGKKINELQQETNTLESRITKIKNDAVKEINDAIDKAIEKLDNHDFYSKNESDKRYASKDLAYTKQESDGKYAEKGEAYTKQESDGKYVDLLSNQEIAGVKNFSEGLQISGKNLTDSLMEMLLNVGKKIWEGAVYLNETQSVKPSIPLDKCLTGWVALYQPYDSKTGKAQPWDLNYMFIPKTHAVDYSGVAIVHHLETLNGAKFNKYIYVSNTEIKGHKNNGTAAKDYVITKLYSV